MSDNGERRQVRVEEEINRWNGFAKVLRTMDREAFGAIMDTYRRLATENADNTSLAPFEQMMLCITTGQMAKIDRVEARLNQLDLPKPKLQPKENELETATPTMIYFKKSSKKVQRGLADFG